MLLLRSASTSIIKAQTLTIKEVCHELLDVLPPKIPKVRSVSNLSTFCSNNNIHSSSSNSTGGLRRTFSENQFSDLLIPPLEEKNDSTTAASAAATATTSASGLLNDDYFGVDEDSCVADNEGCVGNGNNNCNGCGSGGGWHGRFSSSDNNDANAYYRRMVQANPTSSLVLGNYAKYLKEVEGDIEKAQEYCERAIVVGGEGGADGDILSLYAGIMWERSKDAPKAEAYFDRAVRAAPNDCYIKASYAHFLWESEDDEEENGDGYEEEKKGQTNLYAGAEARSLI